MNYGALGVVAGHELNHGFDNRGNFLLILLMKCRYLLCNIICIIYILQVVCTMKTVNI